VRAPSDPDTRDGEPAVQRRQRRRGPSADGAVEPHRFHAAASTRRIDAAATKFELVAAQLAGVAVLRYVTRMEPVASMPVDELAAMMGPAVQAILRPE